MHDVIGADGRDQEDGRRYRPREGVLQEVSGDKLVVLLKGQGEGGDADPDHLHDQDVVGLEGVADAVSSVEEGQEDDDGEADGEDGLHQIEGGGALDVVDDSPSFLDDGRHRGEVGIQKDEVGGIPGGRGAVGHGDGAVGVLHRQDVVDAIPGHADGVLPILQLLDDGCLLLGRDSSEDRVLVDDFGDFPQGEAFQGDALLGVWDVALLGDLGCGQWIVSGDDLDLYSVFREPSDGVGSLGTDVVLQGEDGHGEHPSLDVSVFDVALALAEHDDPVSAALLLGDVADDGPVPVLAVDKLRRSQAIASSVIEADDRELPGRGEGNGVLHPVVVLQGIALGEGDRGLVGLLEGVEIGAHQGRKVLLGIDDQDLVDPHRPVGQGPGLVQAQDVDPGEHLDAVEVLDQGLLLPEVDDTGGQGDGGQKIHSRGNHADHASGGVLHGLGGDVPGLGEALGGLKPLGAEGSDPEGNDDDRDHADQEVEGAEQFGLWFAIDFGSRLDGGGVVVFPDLVGLEGGGTRDHEGTGIDLVSDTFLDG